MIFSENHDFILHKNNDAKGYFYDDMHTLFIEAYQDYQIGIRTNDTDSYREAMAKFMVIYELDDRKK